MEAMKKPLATQLIGCILAGGREGKMGILVRIRKDTVKQGYAIHVRATFGPAQSLTYNSVNDTEDKQMTRIKTGEAQWLRAE
jgi:hypothetical protein